jgi:hypothetical protein
MTWLSNSDHRNIITGAAGAAQNNGGMASGKIVVNKSQGHVIPLSSFPFPATLTFTRWNMLARSLSEQLSTPFDSSQAENKFRYYEQKYHKAKLASQVSGFGVDDADRAKGIHNIDQKMESMCTSYALWDGWFGSSQKYSPASVVCAPGVDSDLDSEEHGGESSGAVIDVDSAVNAIHGGDDGAADDAAIDAAAEFESSQPGAALEPAASHPSHPAAPSQMAPVQVRPKGNAAAAAAAVSAATASKQNLLACVATSPSSGSVANNSSRSSSSSFDQVYATMQAAKSAQIHRPSIIYSSQFYAAQAQLDIAKNHDEHEVACQARGFAHEDRKQMRDYEFQSELQKRKLAFEAEAKGLELAASRADQQAERLVRQRIEFEKNVTQLLEKDPSGVLATNLVTFVDSRFGAVQRPDQQQDAVAIFLERFMNKYT